MLQLLDRGLHGVSRLLRDAEADMTLEEIIDLLAPSQVLGPGLASAPQGAPLQVRDLAYDSRTLAPGALFFCLPGALDDGHRHAEAAVAAGAVALVCERPLPELGLAVPQLVVPSARAAMNRLASPFFGYPSRRMDVVGVTGTNGKTTTTYILDAIFAAAGHVTGLIGTVETRLPGESLPGGRTTPESIDLQRLLGRMAGAAVSFCGMEVTSIGLSQGRVDGTEFRVAIFTNLTQDHLDYHGDLESYYQAKRALFTPQHLRPDAIALVNIDDAYGARLAIELSTLPDDPVQCLTFGLKPGADIRATDVTTGAGGSDFLLQCPGLNAAVHLPLPGVFNVSNALAAVAAAMVLGVPPTAISEGLAGLGRIPGRFEPVEAGQDFSVIVDYAHTPDGLTRVLEAARAMAAGAASPLAVPGRRADPKVIVVFGCGGDRDRGKRPLMGAAAAAGADWVVITSDNPRTEDPSAIIADIQSGIKVGPGGAATAGGCVAVVDRAEAIELALSKAGRGDVVVIAGKGHEVTQAFADHVIDFDDARVAAAILHAHR